jgi:hypothetical protein
MRHFMQEMALPREVRITEILAIIFAAGVKMDMPHRCHCHPLGLKKGPFAEVNAHLFIADRVAKHAAGEGNFAWRQPPC